MKTTEKSSANRADRKDSLKYQWRIYGLVVRSGWATSLDKTIAYEIINGYRKEFGNAQISLRYLEKATGATRTNIVNSTRRLCEDGPFSVVRKGSGNRPTEYAIDFDLVYEGTSSGIADDTSSRGIAHDTPVISDRGIAHDTASSPRGPAHDTESDLLPLTGVRGEVGKPTPAHGAGLAAGHRSAGFEEAFREYGSHGDLEAASAIWATLNPTSELAAHIIAQATSWKRTAKPGQRRMPFEKWLAQEKYGPQNKPAVRTPIRKGCTTRDITILDSEERLNGWSFDIEFNDAEPGERQFGKIRVNENEYAAMEDVLGLTFLEDRVWLFVDDNDNYSFAPRCAA